MQKIKNSFGGVLFGILMIIGGTILLWWNEGNNVRNINSINEVEKSVISVASDKVDAKNDGKLVLVSGDLITSEEELKDEAFNVSIKSARMKRIVEVYQWKEDSSTDDNGNTTYDYVKVWDDDLIDSSQFHQSGHTNPASVEYPEKEFLAASIKVGAFTLADGQKSSLSTNANVVVLTETELPENYSLKSGYVTTSENIDNPQVGDVRISWKYNDWTKSTVLAVQKGDSFIDFVSKDGRKINRVFNGEKSVNEVLETMRSEDKATKWIFRLVGALLIIFGYMALINPLTTLTSFVPFLGGIVGGVLNLIAGLIGLVHALVIIIIAWFRYRPLLAVGLLVVVALAIFGIVTLIKKNKNNKAAKPVEKEA